MKLLFIAHRTPYPPNKGEKIRAYHILSQLVKKHTVSLIYWVDDPKDIQHVNLLRGMCKGGTVIPVYLKSITAKLRAAQALVQGKSFSEAYFYSARFQSEVDRLITKERPDLIYVFSSVMARSLLKWSHIPTLVDFVDVDSEKWGQLAGFKKFPISFVYRCEQRRLLRFERETSRRARACIFVSQAEADLFNQLGGGGKNIVIPNGVDLDVRRLPLRDGQGAADVCGDAPRLIFVGTMSYYPNEDAVLYFAREIFPIVRKAFPNAIFEIIGRSPSRIVRRYDGNDGVRVVGEVSDVRAHLVQADVSVAPMRIARGVQNKVLEAMSVGIPVVATSQAVQGMPAIREDEVLLADTPEVFAAQIVRLLRDAALYRNVSAKARSRVLENYAWKAVGVELLKFIESGPTVTSDQKMETPSLRRGSV